MKLRNSLIVLIAVLLLTAFSGCATELPEDQTQTDTTDLPISNVQDEQGDIVSFRPVDCGIQAQSVYEYPFLGMTAVLPETLLTKLDSREVFAFGDADYTQSYAISYAVLRFSATTQEQREEEGMSVDIYGWEAGLEKIGALGVYETGRVAELDSLTACDTHEKLGESSDGAYEYYLSTNSSAAPDLTAELKKTELTIGEMHVLDPNLGYSAFSADRLDGIATLGAFETEDIFGNAYTQEVFADYDLTLVNVFATWCSPCVEEMPELEKLRQEYAQKGIRLGVIAVVLDAKTAYGTDEDALERAKTLYERSGAQFPFLRPDAGNLNGRLTGIESIPESFFVDASGNIVSEPYIGANTQKGWAQIVDSELAALNGAD